MILFSLGVQGATLPLKQTHLFILCKGIQKYRRLLQKWFDCSVVQHPVSQFPGLQNQRHPLVHRRNRRIRLRRQNHKPLLILVQIIASRHEQHRSILSLVRKFRPAPVPLVKSPGWDNTASVKHTLPERFLFQSTLRPGVDQQFSLVDPRKAPGHHIRCQPSPLISKHHSPLGGQHIPAGHVQFSIQPALNYKGSLAAPGYSYQYIGGDATYVIIPNEVMEMGCLLHYSGESYFGGSLTEPLSCVAGTFHAMYHVTRGKYEHDMGIREGGRMAILAGVGPMGLAAIDYIIHCDRRPSLLIVTDIDDARLARAEQMLSPAEAAENGIKLVYANTGKVENDREFMMSFTDGAGYDDVLVFAPVAPVVELADSILAQDGCLNFFAGPSNPEFSAKFNFYNVHYSGTHVVGTSGGNTEDMKECLRMIGEGKLDPAILVTHIGGMDVARETTLNLPHVPGGKKLIYTHISLPLTAIADFEEKGKTDPLFAKLAELVAETNGLWNAKAEKYLLENAPSI